MTVHSATVPVGFLRVAIKQKGRTLASMVQLNRSIVEVTAEENCLAHAVIIAIAKLNNDTNYKAYRQGRKIRPVIDQFLVTTCINFKNGEGIPEITKLKDHFYDYKIVVYAGLNCESIKFQGHVDSDKRINLLFDEITQNYHVIANLTGALAK